MAPHVRDHRGGFINEAAKVETNFHTQPYVFSNLIHPANATKQTHIQQQHTENMYKTASIKEQINPDLFSTKKSGLKEPTTEKGGYHRRSTSDPILSSNLCPQSTPSFPPEIMTLGFFRSLNPRHKVFGKKTAEVVDYHIQKCGEKTWVVFRINCQYEGKHWTIHRRYNDFVDLHHAIVRELPPHITDDLYLPSRRIFKRIKFDPDYIEKRRLALDAYMKKIISYPEFMCCHAVRTFLSAAWDRYRNPLTGALASRGPQAGMAVVTLPPNSDGSLNNSALGRDRSLSPTQLRSVIARTQQPQPIRRLPARTDANTNQSIESSVTSSQSLPENAPSPTNQKPLPHKRVLQLRYEMNTNLQYTCKGTPTRPIEPISRSVNAINSSSQWASCFTVVVSGSQPRPGRETHGTNIRARSHSMPVSLPAR